MANWASVSYVIEGPISTLDLINGAIEHPNVKEGSDTGWEGNVLNTLGIDWDNPKRDEDTPYMRGFIQENPTYDNEKGILHINAEEAWGLSDFSKVLSEAFPFLNIYWIVEEPGCEVYATNDKNGKYFNSRYYIDLCIDDRYESEYFRTRKDAYKWLSEITDGKVKCKKDIDRFNNNAEDEDDYISMYKFNIE